MTVTLIHAGPAQIVALVFLVLTVMMFSAWWRTKTHPSWMLMIVVGLAILGGVINSTHIV